MRGLVVAMALAPILSGCDSAPSATLNDDTKKLEARIAALETETQALRTNIEGQKGLVDAARLEAEAALSLYNEAVFDPTDSRFQRIDVEGGVGSFAVSVQDVRQFGDGVRVRLNLGNLTAARIDGAHLKLKYGPRRPQSTDLLSWQGI